ncbi:hypothetical protein SK39_03002 [Citrobacter sp. BIDMC107]|nr:hypothetical protein SK39_03002 [Citrobacter sp. BIDMC107]
MKLYNGTHGDHVFDYKVQIEQTLNNSIRQYPRTMALRVDLHYPPILDRGDTISCFHNQEPGAISRFLNALKATLSASEERRMRDGTREGANKQVISSQADSLIKISRIWADFFPANTSNQPI